MWPEVERDLAQILSSRLFPAAATDPGYIPLLRNAGLTSINEYQNGKLDPSLAKTQADWRKSIPMKEPPNLHSSVKNLPPTIRTRLETAARMCAQLMIRDVIALNALNETTAKAVILEGSMTLYRIWDNSMDNQTRHWWFSQKLLDLAAKQSAAERISIRDWLRDRLAVSLNFGKCDRLSRMILGPSGALPAIEALGLPMPQRTPVTRDAAGNTVGVADKEYLEKLGMTFRGEKIQYFLPFVPPDRILEANWP
jgi:hypothetical protein